MTTLELNKIVGAVLVAGLVVLGSSLLAERLVPDMVRHTGLGAVPSETATEEAPIAAAPEPAKRVEPVSALLASADPAAGQTIAKRCATCHTFEKGGPAKVGPNLWGIVGNKHAHMEGFPYSKAIAELPGTWSYEDLNAFVASPKTYAPGTKMAFAGLAKVQDRANVIAWLRTLSDAPAPLPTAEEIAATQAQAEAATPATEPAQETGETQGTAGAAGTASVAAATAQAQGQAATASTGGTAAPAGGTAATTQTAAAAAPIGPLIAAADPAAGEKIAKRCAVCHTFDKDGPNKVGPNLWGIVGAPHAHKDDFRYSEAIAGIAKPWDYDELNAFLSDPKAYAPGTKMSFAGLKKADERAAVIAFLRTLSDNPAPLPQQ